MSKHGGYDCARRDEAQNLRSVGRRSTTVRRRSQLTDCGKLAAKENKHIEASRSESLGVFSPFKREQTHEFASRWIVCSMKCIQCASMIEADLNGRPPVSAKYCLKCRSERRRRCSVKYKWTTEHDACLRQHYHGGIHQRGRVISALARVASFPRWYIKRHAQEIGLAMPADRRPWTHEDTETLEGMLGRVSAKRIAKKLRRTETSVIMKIKSIGTSRRVVEGHTMRDLATCLGEDHHKIQKWI